MSKGVDPENEDGTPAAKAMCMFVEVMEPSAELGECSDSDEREQNKEQVTRGDVDPSKSIDQFKPFELLGHSRGV